MFVIIASKTYVYKESLGKASLITDLLLSFKLSFWYFSCSFDVKYEKQNNSLQIICFSSDGNKVIVMPGMHYRITG